MPVSESGIIDDPEDHFFPPEEPPHEEQEQPETVIPAQFDPRSMDDFQGLLFIGALTDEFVWAGHKFVIRTLRAGEYLEVGLIQKRYRDSLGESNAYVAAMVAAAIISVDGQQLPAPISNATTDTRLHNHFRYITDHWYTWTIDAVYNRVVLLEARVEEALASMGEARGRTA